MMQGRKILTTSIPLALSGAMWVSACGGDDNDNATDDAGRPDVTTVDENGAPDGEGSADDDGAGGQDSGSGGGSDKCPLTAEQVGGVLGKEVTVDEAACSFYPADDSLPPNANYVDQFELACSEQARADLGYEEPVEGIGAQAFVQPETAIGTMVLVCAGDSVFEITVDSDASADSEQAAAEELARLVLSSR